jgi:hypothetical protein
MGAMKPAARQFARTSTAGREHAKQRGDRAYNCICASHLWLVK